MDNYDEIKYNLINKGYELNDNKFIKTHTQTHQMMINGTPFSQEKTTTMTIEYGGEGYYEDLDETNRVILYCFNIIKDENLIGSLCVNNWDEFSSMLKI